VRGDHRQRLGGLHHAQIQAGGIGVSVENPYYSHEFHGDYDVVSIGRLDLEEGGSIPDCRLAVTTWGELNEARDNAILITTWYSGTHQIWRDVYVGPEHALNPDRFFIVAINQVGNGLSTSPHNAPDEIAMSRFPKGVALLQ
jgi:homoserine O-acetyltransferase